MGRFLNGIKKSFESYVYLNEILYLEVSLSDEFKFDIYFNIKILFLYKKKKYEGDPPYKSFKIYDFS